MELTGKIIDVMEAITVNGTTTFVPTMSCDSNSQHLQQNVDPMPFDVGSDLFPPFMEEKGKDAPF